jgi:hypothetical protein
MPCGAPRRCNEPAQQPRRAVTHARRRPARAPAEHEERTSLAPRQRDTPRALDAHESHDEPACLPGAGAGPDRADAGGRGPGTRVAIRDIHQADAARGRPRDRAGAEPSAAGPAPRRHTSTGGDQPGDHAGGQLADIQPADVPGRQTHGRSWRVVAAQRRTLPVRPGNYARPSAGTLTGLASHTRPYPGGQTRQPWARDTSRSQHNRYMPVTYPAAESGPVTGWPARAR